MAICKYMRSKYNYTPNDYDLYFDFTEIPSNIQLNDAVNLSRNLASSTPLSKKVHIHFNQSYKEFYQKIAIRTALKVNGVEVKIV